MKQTLIQEARKRISDEDPSHDFSHALRVLANAELIARQEGGDLEVIIPAALFHDIVNIPKNNPKSDLAADESAKVAEEILQNLDYPKSKIHLVMQAIIEHSFSKGIKPKLKESQIVQDADRIECTGAVAVMRTFSSGGQMKRKFYEEKDPFGNNRKLDCHKYALDFFKTRLTKVCDTMNTECARKIAEERTAFLLNFLEQVKKEINETG